MRAADGGQETTLLDALGYPDSFTRDGRFLLYGTAREPYYELFALPLTGTDRQPIPLVTGLSLADEGHFSPNSRWVAYHASAGGSPEVYVIPFPPTGEKWKVSSEGGVQPRWHPKGAELFYLDPSGRLMSVSMPDSDPRRAAAPRVLFETGLEASPAYDQFAVGPDGKRFLFRQLDRADQASGSPIHVLVNWMDRR
jgi:Tol biopolymer transport system component